MRRKGFTLIELLVVMGIIAVLVGLLLPSLSKARKQSNRTACLSNLRQVYFCYQFYAQSFGDQIPIGFDGPAQAEQGDFYIHNSAARRGVRSRPCLGFSLMRIWRTARRFFIVRARGIRSISLIRRRIRGRRWRVRILMLRSRAGRWCIGRIVRFRYRWRGWRR